MRLRLPDPGGPQEDERTDGAIGIRQPGPGPPDGVGHRGHRLVLADDPLVQAVLHVHELLDLALHQLRDRDACPLADHLGDVLLVDLLLQHLPVGLEDRERVVGRIELLLELWDPPVLDLGRLLQVAGARGALTLALRLLDLSLEVADAGDGVLLLLPVRLHSGASLPKVGQLLLEPGQALLRRRVGLLAERCALDLELLDAPLDLVDLDRHRVDLDAEAAGRLVDEVDGLVRQEPAGHVAM